MDTEIEIQGKYYDGWEMVTTAEDDAEANALLADYRANEPGTTFRKKIVKVEV